MDNYYNKYLKYKNKYTELKGGNFSIDDLKKNVYDPYILKIQKYKDEIAKIKTYYAYLQDPSKYTEIINEYEIKIKIIETYQICSNTASISNFINCAQNMVKSLLAASKLTKI